MRGYINFDPITESNNTGEVQLFVRSSPGNNLSGGLNFDSGITDGQWHNLIFAWDKAAGNINIHLDGASQSITYGSQDTGTSWVTWQHPLHIGAFNRMGTTQNFMAGLLDDLNIWSRALSSSEMYAQYVESKAVYPHALNWRKSVGFAPLAIELPPTVLGKILYANAGGKTINVPPSRTVYTRGPTENVKVF